MPNPSCNISPAVCQNESREIQNESLSKQTYQRTRRYNTQRREQDMKDLQKIIACSIRKEMKKYRRYNMSSFDRIYVPPAQPLQPQMAPRYYQ